jgi:DUF971 family protein
MAAVEPLRPRSLKRDGDVLRIEWADGVTTTVPWQKLRANCPCAGCAEERAKPPDPLRVLKPNEVAAGPLQPVKMEPRGYYAYQIAWNDGHDTGIYTLETLRALSTPVASDSSANTV